MMHFIGIIIWIVLKEDHDGEGNDLNIYYNSRNLPWKRQTADRSNLSKKDLRVACSPKYKQMLMDINRSIWATDNFERVNMKT